MQSLTLGIFASLLSAAIALIITSIGSQAVHPLWLLMMQYVVGSVIALPRNRPVVKLRLHGWRLITGLWAFGAYYVALGIQGASAAEASMILNSAPIFATFYAISQIRARLSAIIAFIGISMMLSANEAYIEFELWQLLALSAALAYAASFVILGRLSNLGEHPNTTNSIYNLLAGLAIGILLLVYQPALPTSWWPVFAVGGIAALRIQVLTFAASSVETSARVSVLTNLAFVWLALVEWFQGRMYSPFEWVAMVLVVAAMGLMRPNHEKSNRK
ncbi:DMT family transporter [Vibrio sp. ZSDE26]|uniref:DMT family transporter n=1 Tax=Vibrio amylolyticus TaxID=2847292 RepID=A0A9X1XJA8_9VIBR|nr:DMT family transporter [Vibrio amylolyticus]MCK6263969.1 DMT family transporter [Vibrio amylolyticus]